MSKTIDDLRQHRGLNLVHLNIRSLWNKIDLFKTTFKSSNVDILGISESWLSNAIPDALVNIPGYTILRQDRKYSGNDATQIKKGGGVCLYIHDQLNGSICELKDMNRSIDYVESQWVEIRFPKQRNIIVGNIYRPPQGNVKNFLEYLEECMEQIDYIHNDIIIMGDINIDFKDTNLSDTKELKEILSQTGLTSFIKTPTRYSETKNSCLDHIYSNSNIIQDSGTIDINISDHLPVFINRKKPNVISEKAKFTGRSYRKDDKDVFNAGLERQDWEVFDNANDPNLLWEIFKKNVLKVLDQCCPQKTFTIKKYKEPWITNELLELIKDKDLALGKAKKSRKNTDWDLARRLRNECLSKICRAKCEFVKTELNNNQNDSKKFWKNVHDIWPKKQSNSSKIT